MGKAGGKSITRVITREQAHTDFQAVRARYEFASCHVDPRVLDQACAKQHYFNYPELMREQQRRLMTHLHQVKIK